MQRCWALKSTDRPTFNKLTHWLDAHISQTTDSVRPIVNTLVHWVSPTLSIVTWRRINRFEQFSVWIFLTQLAIEWPWNFPPHPTSASALPGENGTYIPTKHFSNLIIPLQVTIDNVGDPFWDTVYTNNFCTVRYDVSFMKTREILHGIRDTSASVYYHSPVTTEQRLMLWNRKSKTPLWSPEILFYPQDNLHVHLKQSTNYNHCYCTSVS